MLTGFNNNIVYRDEVYHVQTENRGIENLEIVTLIYKKGAIVASKRNKYDEIMSDEDSEETIKQLMENQHKNMIKALIGGQLDV